MTSIAGGHGETSPNSSWLSARGFWLAYFLGLLFVHLLLLSVPFVTISMAWTATNLLHNFVSIRSSSQQYDILLTSFIFFRHICISCI